ncbi:hypothetical protein QE152_g22372 [Popillia japonica]|uniref:Uncharacterized protein n=1 Tax=Popillia japonica TaxID=7064 RepID=A0AAW1KLZ6_POPJA
MKPPPNVVILQNETINADNTATLKKKLPLKRPSKDPDSASKLKKTKKVSFGNCYSQEDQISNNTITSDSQNKNEVSSYFSKIDNVNMFEPQPSFLHSMDDFMPSQDFYQEDGDPDNIMKDLMISKDDEKSLELSNYKSLDNSQLSTIGLF